MLDGLLLPFDPRQQTFAGEKSGGGNATETHRRLERLVAALLIEEDIQISQGVSRGWSDLSQRHQGTAASDLSSLQLLANQRDGQRSHRPGFAQPSNGFRPGPRGSR